MIDIPESLSLIWKISGACVIGIIGLGAGLRTTTVNSTKKENYYNWIIQLHKGKKKKKKKDRYKICLLSLRIDGSNIFLLYQYIDTPW